MQNNNSIAKRSSQNGDSMLAYDADDIYVDGYYGASPEPSERQQLFNLLGIFRKYWLMILGITVLGTCLVIIYEARKPDYYTAEARIQINNEIGPGGRGANPIVLTPGSDPAYFSTQLQILEGPGLLRRVVKTMDLENNSAFWGSGKGDTTLWQNVQRMFGYNRPARLDQNNKDGSATAKQRLNVLKESATDLDKQAEALAPFVGSIRGNLNVTPVRDNRTARAETRLIKVEYTHHDPQLATKVVNTIADVYILQNLELKNESNASASEFLQKRVAELQSQIRAGEERLINYAKSNQILSLDSSQNTVVQRLADLNGKLSQAENDRITAEAAYRAAAQNPLSATSAESRDGRTAGLEGQLTALRQQLEQLKVEYTDEWPAVQQVQRQIATIEKELQSNRKRSSDTQIASLQQTLREASGRERELRMNFETQRNRVLDQNEAAINYRIIQQEIDTNKALLNSLLQQSRTTEVILDGTPNNVHVVDRALVPGAPNGPERTKNVMIAFLASLFGGIGLAFALNWLDDTIRVNDNFEMQLGVPVIGMIPGVSGGLASRLLKSRFGKSDNRLVGKRHAYPLKKLDSPVVNEAFYQLRTSFLLSTAGGSPKTVLVTSGQPFEGKTTVSLNLAKSLAQLGKSVLLIDGDLRCPKMHVLNDVSNTVGLSTLLTAKEINASSIRETVQNIVGHLDILTSGPKVPNPANLFSSPEMRSLLQQLGAIYSHIVIDSPPVLYFADSMILSTGVDAVILVARSDYSSREVLARAKTKLQNMRANVVGVVVNGVPISNYKYHNSEYYQDLEQADVEESGTSVLHLD